MAPKEEKGKGKVPSETLHTLFSWQLCEMTAESSTASSDVPLVPMEQPGLFPAPPPSEAETTTPSVVLGGLRGRVASVVGKMPEPAHRLSTLESEFVEAARHWAFLQHRKDQEESPIHLQALGTYHGLQDLSLNRGYKTGGSWPPSELQKEKAQHAKKKAAVAVCDKITKLTRLLEEVVMDEGEEFAEVVRRGEEEGEEETEEELEGEDLEGFEGLFGPFGGFGGVGSAGGLGGLGGLGIAV
ncbi:uncharacterized protein SPPG_06306 [Spizellomyces punctatus DAOM BR117]|uniref:Uncharacterized protein n=1 Tax=Spizellomyces punctatus (strain DAOM BR117) TaxID=645134 RepID=A0A0L0HCL5_SPIPD|nr:uncharacterized protein SPPG_06306 [Spizellomyces punctatus DAOM BR117]KNC98624.1 hypothetical protein SPPG_06306 [Spizellomyces punctatus DAOM BR117]|eukprot:XP_016606664.1 hypothetical protein SPPG_06306 [Spizellomyces punctatus DAOM BR117]